MADAGGDEVQVAPVAQEPMDTNAALKAVLRAAHHADGLAKGLNETCKALDKREAHFCVLAENCDEPNYVKLIESLCAEHNIPLIKVADKKIIGEYCGLCKYDKEGKARKVVGCSSCVVKSWGNEERGREVLMNYFKSRN